MASTVQQLQNLAVLGLGQLTTAYYLAQLNRAYQIDKGEDSTCPLTLFNADFNEINPYLPSQFEKLVPAVMPYLERLKAYQKVVIPNITLHETLDRIPNITQTVPGLLHPVDLTLDAIVGSNISEVVLLASSYTATSPYLRHKFQARGVTIKPYSEAERIDAYRRKIYSGKATPQDAAALNQLTLEALQDTSVVVACTELSIVNTHHHPAIFDMTTIQIKAAIA